MRTPLRKSRLHPVRVFSVTGTLDAATTVLENFRDQRFISEQRRAAQPVAHFLGRAAHVDVDDLRAEIDIAARGFGQRLRIRARELHHARLGLAGVIHAQLRLFRASKAARHW